MQIAFYKAPGDWTDQLIRWATRSPYSHCELLLTPLTAHGVATAISSSPRDGGVRTVKIWFRPERWDVIDLPFPSADVEHRAKSQLGLGYDLIGAVASQLPRLRPHSRQRWFCSELLAWSLGMAAPETLSPGELYLRLGDMAHAYNLGRSAA